MSNLNLESSTFRISALIRIPLFTLYLALTLPLPFLSQVTTAPVSPGVLWGAIGIGFIILYAALSEQVIVDNEGIKVNYPGWIPPWFRKGWALSWSDIKALKPRTTGQGGLVYYFLSDSGEGYLLPMRIAGFARLVKIVEVKTGIDTTDIRPLSQPWMYLALFVCTILLLFADILIILTAKQSGF